MNRRFFMLLNASTLFFNKWFEEPKKTWTFRIAKADKPNCNKRIYPKNVLENIVKNFYNNPDTMFGHIGVESNRLSDSSHVVKELSIQKNYLVATIKPLDTPNGKKLRKMLNSNRVTFRTMGTANIRHTPTGDVVENYHLLGVSALTLDQAVKL
jgi:hypothetical protein